MGRLKFAFLLGILITGFILRLYRFDNPIADWHSWRQADTSSVSREFAENGFDILHPKFHDLSNVPSGIDNPKGYRFVEFPIYNIFQAVFFVAFHFFTLEEWGRLITIFSSLSSSVFIFLILRKHQGEFAGLLGAFFFAVLPYNVFYGRTILPDPSTAAAILAGIYFFDEWTEKAQKTNFKSLLFFTLSIVFTAAAFLLKPFALFFTLPMIFLAFNRFEKKVFLNPYLWVFAILTVLPFASWRIWMMQFPEGIPVSSWLFNEGNIRFKGAYFNWIFAERVGKLILGYFGIGILICGFLTKIKKDSVFIYAFLLSSLIYLVVIARGNVQHDYYQILIMPTICIFLGLGGDFLMNPARQFSFRFTGHLVFAVCAFLAFLFSWYHIRDYFNINNQSIITAGRAVDRITPKDAQVIANYEGDTTFLYQTRRKGWASYQKDIPEMVNLGADYLVLANPTQSDYKFGELYEIVDKAPEYLIFDLHKTK